MGERKVLNKCIPADCDPKLVPRGTKPKDDVVPVRMMLPFSLQCSTCFAQKREMDDLDALDEIKAMNLRHIRLLSGQNNTDSATNTSAAGGFEAVQAVLRATDGKIQITEEDGEEVNENGLTATEEALVKSIKFGNTDPHQHERALILSNSDKTFEIKRLDENDEKMIELQRS